MVVKYFSIIIWILFLTDFYFSSLNVRGDRDAANRLRKRIFSNYSTTQRPVKNQKKSVEVKAKMWIFHVEEVNDTKQTIKFHGVMQMSWKDEFLNWNPNDYDGMKYIITNNVAIWTPKLTLLNSADPNTFNHYWNLPVKVWHTGDIYATVELSVTSTCAFDFTNFPYDTQRCPVAFYLGATMDQVYFSHIIDPELRFYWRQAEGSQRNANAKRTASNWDVMETPELYRKYYTANGLNDTLGDTAPYSVTMIMEFWITFRRRLAYFQLAIVLPAVLTSIITVAAMMPMRTIYSLGILMLNLLAQVSYIDDLFSIIPKSIGIIPSIVQFYAINLILTVLAIFARLLIQWSQNTQKDDSMKSKEEEKQDPHTSIFEKVETKSHCDILFFYCTPFRLHAFFIVSYILIYSICAGIFL